MKFFLPAFLLFLFSCNQPGEKKICSDTIPPSTMLAGEQTEAVKKYYTWYNDHMNELYQFNTVKNCPNKGDTTQTYRVDFDGTEKWLKAFQSSGLVSGHFITSWRDYFKKCDENFIAEPAWDGPPAGFDYDLIWNSQEEAPTNEMIGKMQLVKTEPKGDRTAITVVIPGYYDTLTKILEKAPGGKWKIYE